MPKEQLITIVGDGPTGVDTYEWSKYGLKNLVQNRFFPEYRQIEVELLAATVDRFVAGVHDGIWVVASVFESHTVVGGSNAAVQVVVCPQAVAIASGVAQLTAGFDLTVTAPAKAFGTMIASPTQMTRGDVLGIDLSGTLTGLVGMLDIILKRIG